MLALAFKLTENYYDSLTFFKLISVKVTIPFDLWMEIFYIVGLRTYFKLAQVDFRGLVWSEQNINPAAPNTNLSSCILNNVTKHYFIFNGPELTKEIGQTMLVVTLGE